MNDAFMQFPRLPLQDPIRGIIGRAVEVLIQDVVINQIPYYQNLNIPVRYVPVVSLQEAQGPAMETPPSQTLLQELLVQQARANTRLRQGGGE